MFSKAKACSLITKVVCSTDDERLPKSPRMGVEVPFMRPAHLSGDQQDSVLGSCLSGSPRENAKAPRRSGLFAQGLALNLTIGAYCLENSLYDSGPEDLKKSAEQ